MTGKSLAFLGFGEYKTFITGALHEPKELLDCSEVLIEAKKMGEWLLNC